ncbi:MAG: AAA family ATPase [Candidatus Aminicenantes bacterium]|nr:AAA family ATPase [Candidatus Aminicenantes bacterium]
MYLSELKLWNFRLFGSGNDNLNLEKPDLELCFSEGLNVLIGENDSGKSAIIDAIKLVLKTHSYEWIKITEEDFNKDTLRFRIELKFNGLSDEESKNFTEWLGWKSEGEKAKTFLRLIYDVKRNNERIFPADVRAGIDDEGYQLTAEAKDYLKATYLKPLRDAKSELIPKKNSRLSQILKEHEAFRGKEKGHYLLKIFRDFNDSIEKYFNGKDDRDDASLDHDQKGKELKDEIDGYIQLLYDETKESKFEVVGGELKNILEKLELLIKDEINPGLGTLNRLFISTELLHLEKKNWHGVRLGLIEELEAHLHPQAQMRVIESLQKRKNIQLILTTHSPNLGSKVKLENLIICEKENRNVFPMGNIYTRLEGPDYKFLERFLDVTKANLFFAKGVILVEGWAEELIIPVLAKKIGIYLTQKGVSIINVGSTALLRFAKIFQRKKEPHMNIPVAVITDLDLKPEEYDVFKKIKKHKTKRKNLCITGYTKDEIDRYKKKKKYDCEDCKSVVTFISEYWTLEYCIALSENLRKGFYKAVLRALMEQKEDKGVERLENYQQAIDNIDNHFDNWSESRENIALNIYLQILGEKKVLNLSKGKISKAIIAQHFAEILKEDNQEIMVSESDEAIKYLIDAIKYAAGKSTNH